MSKKTEILSVSELTRRIRDILEQDLLLSGVWVRGEIFDFKLYQKSGHVYFSLKDEGAVINCVMFRSRVRGIRFRPANGMKVIVRGYISVFEKSGRYQLYVEEMEPDGLGARFLQLCQLKERLEKEGLFALERKRPLPRFAKKVGVVTSQDGAAWRDILRIIRQRCPGTEVVIAHSTVQGETAPAEIAAAIQALNRYTDVEVIIVGRGGGSFEDLWAFNSEDVVRAVSSSALPVISAVGHEIDYSLCDLAADARAATPSQAAQMVVPDMPALHRELLVLRRRLQKALERSIASRWQQLDYLKSKKVWSEPGGLLQHRRKQLAETGNRLVRAATARLTEKAYALGNAAGRLDALSPLKVLERGYALVRRLEAGEIVKNVEDVHIGELMEIILGKGRMVAEVQTKELGEGWKR